jgi:hypothetical protein
MKAQADSSSRGQKNFICREEKRKAACGHVGGPGSQWSCGSGWKLGFYSLFYCPRAEMSLRCKQKFPWKKCLLGQLSPSGMSCSPSFNLPLSMITLTAGRDRDKEDYSVTTSCLQGEVKGPTASGLTKRGVNEETMTVGHTHLHQGHL